MRRLTALLALLASTALAPPAFAQDVAAKPAFAEPTLSPDGQFIAFASGGDIWEVAAAGGTARLLVTDAATEARPLYAPDGRRLAFTSTRGGSVNVYVLDLASGTVTRLTWGEANEELDAWSADGRYLYFASASEDVGRTPDIFRVDAAGGMPMPVSRELYLSEFQAAPSPDGTRLALMARGISDGQWWRNGHSHIDETELWVRPVADGAGYRRLLPGGAKQAWPMWSRDGQAITYMSDRSGAENLWRVVLGDGAAPEQLTRFADGRLLYPQMTASGAVVFERDFGIWRYDPATGQAAAVPIVLRGAASGTPRRHEQLASFSRMALSPDAQKVAVIGHGELFAAPAKDGGPAQRLTNTPGAEREVAWSPDSRRALVVGERGLVHVLTEYDVASGRATQLTTRGVASTPAYAPDGKSAVYVLDDRELHLVTLGANGTGGIDRVLFTGAIATDAPYGPVPVWSPDGQYVAFPVTDARSFTNIHIVAAAGGAARPATFLANGQMGRIAWSPDGRYLLFDTAQRSEDSKIVRVDLLPHVPRFKEDAFRDLFKPGQQPGTPDTPDDKTAAPPSPKPLSAAAKKGAPPPKVPPVTIIWEGLRNRATILPLGLNADTPVISNDGKTLVFRAQERGRANFYSYNLDELADEPPVAQQLTQSEKPKGDFALSGDGKTLFYLDGGRVVSTPLDTPRPKPVAIAAEMDVDFATEKQVVFDEAWGVLNRKFYDPRFNGRDWVALRARFQPYVAGARTSDELRRIVNLMIGELNASHSGMGRPRRGPGSLPIDRVGNLGLRFDRAAYESGRGLVVRDVVALGPAAIERVAPGDRIVSVGGVTLDARSNLDALLENNVGRRVAVGTVTPAGARRDVVLRPVSAAVAAGLAYRQWVEGRRALVAKMSGGRLGYVHISDMSSESLDQLYLDLDAENQGKQGVVVDIRNNSGGFVNGYALDVFSRRNYLTMTPRDLFPVPGRQALGQRALGRPTVLVTNESSLSDAEDFTEGYRALGLGKVVGQPTAGWIIFTGSEPLIDGSTVRLPGVRVEDGRGQDMEMHPRPVDLAVERPLGEGPDEDAQLRAAVDTLLGQVGK